MVDPCRLIEVDVITQCAELHAEHDLLPPAGDRTADEHLVVPHAIEVNRIDEVEPASRAALTVASPSASFPTKRMVLHGEKSAFAVVFSSSGNG